MAQNITAVIDQPTINTRTGDVETPTVTTNVVRATFEQEPFVGPRKGRRNLFVPQESVAGSQAELVALHQSDPRNLNAVGTHLEATVRIGTAVVALRASEFGGGDFRRLGPVLRPAAYPTQGHYIGKYVVENEDGNHAIWFNSLNELNHITHLDWEGVRDLNSQCVQFSWTLPSGRVIYHYPDIVKRWHGRVGIVDVTAFDGVTPTKAAVLDLTARTCRHFGWDYEVGLDSISMARQRNLRYLRAFRRQPVPAWEWGDEPHPRTLWGLVQAYGGDTAAWRRALAHLWFRQVGFDMDVLLDDTTVLLDTPASSPRIAWEVAK